MRARDVPQARQHARPVLVAVLVMTIVVLVAVTVLMTVAVLVAVLVLVLVLVVLLVIAVVARAAHAVHDIQHARVNALQHIDKYQARVLAN
jgi:Ca2+/Na+ antiporter